VTSPCTTLIGKDCRLDLRQPQIMGILNVTPDSFSDGGSYSDAEAALQQVRLMVAAGAGIIDIGGESTRPGSLPVSAAEEIRRVEPVVKLIRERFTIPLSVDTNKSQVALAAMAAGANFINDISGLSFDPAMVEVAAQSGAGLFLMHTRGTPDLMQKDTDYEDLLADVTAFLRNSIALAQAHGIARERIAVDPGIGFGKDVCGNLELLHHLQRLHALGCPVLLGTSRKSFIGHILKQPDPRSRLAGTLATVALGVQQGVQMFRVHDVAPAFEAAHIAWAITHRQIPAIPNR